MLDGVSLLIGGQYGDQQMFFTLFLVEYFFHKTHLMHEK